MDLAWLADSASDLTGTIHPRTVVSTVHGVYAHAIYLAILRLFLRKSKTVPKGPHSSSSVEGRGDGKGFVGVRE